MEPAVKAVYSDVITGCPAPGSHPRDITLPDSDTVPPGALRSPMPQLLQLCLHSSGQCPRRAHAAGEGTDIELSTQPLRHQLDRPQIVAEIRVGEVRVGDGEVAV